jgi:hypothetical protein
MKTAGAGHGGGEISAGESSWRYQRHQLMAGIGQRKRSARNGAAENGGEMKRNGE